jgi:hypothetical protein
MKIEFTKGIRRPKDHIQTAKLSSEVGIQIRNKMPLVTNWTQYKKDKALEDVIPTAIRKVVVSPNISVLHLTYLTWLQM